MLISVPHRMNDTFLTIYMQHLGGGESQIGVAWLIATLSGVPTMALAGRLFRKFNEIVLLSAAGAFYSVRWIVFHFAESPAAIFAGQMMQALTFPIVLMAAVHFIHLHVPHELKATGQTLFTACFSGIGGIIGSVAGGWLMDSFAPQTPYLIGIVFALCASVLIFAFRSFLVKKEDYAAGASGAP